MSEVNKLLRKADILVYGINDKKLSLQAKGLLAFICLNPEPRTRKQLREITRSELDNALFDCVVRELIEQGYLEERKQTPVRLVK